MNAWLPWPLSLLGTSWFSSRPHQAFCTCPRYWGAGHEARTCLLVVLRDHAKKHMMGRRRRDKKKKGRPGGSLGTQKMTACPSLSTEYLCA